MASELSFSIFVHVCLIWLFLGFALVGILLGIDFLRAMRPRERDVPAAEPSGHPEREP